MSKPFDELRKQMSTEAQLRAKDKTNELLREITLNEVRALVRSKLFQQFISQGFWHAHHVDLVWRMDGKDVHEQADWLKDLWYALRGKPLEQPPSDSMDAAVQAMRDEDFINWGQQMPADHYRALLRVALQTMDSMRAAPQGLQQGAAHELSALVGKWIAQGIADTQINHAITRYSSAKDECADELEAILKRWEGK